MIQFQELMVQDFMAIHEALYNFGDPATRLLLGQNKDSLAADDNGAGKSSLAEALKWVLYGETTRQAIDKSLTVDHVIRKGAQEAVVGVLFKVGDNIWTVSRTRSTKSQTLKVQMVSSTGVQEVWLGPVAQEQLLKALGVDVVQFSNLVYLDGSYPLLFAPSNDRTRKDILADLVDVAIVQQAQDHVASVLKPIKEEMEKLDRGIQEGRSNIQVYKALQNDLKVKARGYKKDLLKAEKALANAKDEVSGLQRRVAEVETELSDAEEAITAKLKSARVIYVARMEKHEEAIVAKDKALSFYNMDEIDEAKGRERELSVDIRNTRREVQKISALRKQGKCPTCGQETDEVGKDDLEELYKALKEYEHELTLTQASIKELEKERKEYLASATRIVEATREYASKAGDVIQEIEDGTEIAALKNALQTLRGPLRKAEADLHACDMRVNSLKTGISGSKHEYDNAQTKIEAKESEISGMETRLEELTKKAHNLEFWKAGFGPKGVPSLFIETVLPRISSRIQRFADILTGGDLTVTLQAYKETKSKTVQEAIQISAVNAKGASVYGANSAGERNRINLAVTLGLIDYFRDMGVFSSSLLICDEIFDGLDRTGVEKALWALKEADIHHVLVISHHEHLKPMFPDTMYMVKENGAARLEG